MSALKQDQKTIVFLAAKNAELLKANADLVEEVDKLRKLVQGKITTPYEFLMPCGHESRYTMNGEEGTSSCLMCEFMAQKQDAKSESRWADHYFDLASCPNCKNILNWENCSNCGELLVRPR